MTLVTLQFHSQLLCNEKSQYLSLIELGLITFGAPIARPIPARSRPGIGDSQPDPLGLLLPPVRSRPGIDEFSLGVSPFTVEFQEALDEIGPMTRNPERDTERSWVVLAWSPSLVLKLCKTRPTDVQAGLTTPRTDQMFGPMPILTSPNIENLRNPFSPSRHGPIGP